MDIRFHIPKDQIIPTDLILKADDVMAKYCRIKGGFIFDVYTGDAEKARDIVQAVVRQMIVDHDESQHGVTWETVSLNEISNASWVGCHSYAWTYRVRDSY